MGETRKCDRGGLGRNPCQNVATQHVVGTPGVEVYGCDGCIERYRDTMPGVVWAPLPSVAEDEGAARG